jgi:hypothetical protein
MQPAQLSCVAGCRLHIMQQRRLVPVTFDNFVICQRHNKKQKAYFCNNSAYLIGSVLWANGIL